MAVNDADKSHKPHRSRQSGASSKKKAKSDEKKKKQEVGEDQKKQNPKVLFLFVLGSTCLFREGEIVVCRVYIYIFNGVA